MQQRDSTDTFERDGLVGKLSNESRVGEVGVRKRQLDVAALEHHDVIEAALRQHDARVDVRQSRAIRSGERLARREERAIGASRCETDRAAGNIRGGGGTAA